MEIIPYLQMAKRGFKTTVPLCEIVNSILYKLKTGVQWHLLPVESLFSEKVLSHKTVLAIIATGANKIYGNVVGSTFYPNINLI